MKRAVVIGASSGIGRQVAQLLVQDGWHVAIAARRLETLEELRCIAPERIVTGQIDVNAADAQERLLHLVNQLGGMNLYFHAAGIGWQNPQLEADKELSTAETNVQGFTRMVGAAFRYFSEGTGGHIAVISSIAGTKGLGPAPAYSATKAYQNTYIQALEQLANARKLHISFTDIRPGFVRTPLLFPDTVEPLPSYPMLLSPQRVAKKIVKALYKKRHVVVIDGRWRMVTFLWRLIPDWLWRRLNLLR